MYHDVSHCNYSVRIVLWISYSIFSFGTGCRNSEPLFQYVDVDAGCRTSEPLFQYVDVNVDIPRCKRCYRQSNRIPHDFPDHRKTIEPAYRVTNLIPHTGTSFSTYTVSNQSTHPSTHFDRSARADGSTHSNGRSSNRISNGKTHHG